jgi:predicted PurR-regulated permease PerM
MLPRFTDFLASGQLGNILATLTQKIHILLPRVHVNDEHILNIAQQITSSAPVLLGATANMLMNAVLAFFLLYFMLVDGRKMEYTIMRYLPLKDSNIDDVWQSTRVVVVASAIGIPVLAAFQAITASIGYVIFGVESYILWGVLTGLCSVVPVVGTAVIWLPLSIYLIAIGHTPQGVGLMLFSVFVTGTIDNVLRFTLLKRLGDVHPVVTALGIIIGVPLFGFMGFIFGPLLISYLLLLIKIYRIEFSPNTP